MSGEITSQTRARAPRGRLAAAWIAAVLAAGGCGTESVSGQSDRPATPAHAPSVSSETTPKTSPSRSGRVTAEGVPTDTKNMTPEMLARMRALIARGFSCKLEAAGIVGTNPSPDFDGNIPPGGGMQLTVSVATTAESRAAKSTFGPSGLIQDQFKAQAEIMGPKASGLTSGLTLKTTPNINMRDPQDGLLPELTIASIPSGFNEGTQLRIYATRTAFTPDGVVDDTNHSHIYQTYCEGAAVFDGQTWSFDPNVPAGLPLADGARG